jgi:hypothetical protein
MGLKIEYFSLSINPQKALNLVRDLGVLSRRILCNKGVRWCAKESLPVRVKWCFILRAVSQFDAVRELIESLSEPVVIVYSNIFVADNLEKRLLDWGKNFENIFLIPLPSLSKKHVISVYRKTLSRLFRNQMQQREVVQINVKQAFREILIMSAEVSIYQQRIKNIIDFIPVEILVTCEQKSPQGYVESKAAREIGIKSVQLLCFDQEASDLPFPVYADTFIVDTAKREELLRDAWSTCVSKITYLGPIRALKPPKDVMRREFDVCYFGHVYEKKHNLKIVEQLKKFQSECSLSFCVKLHPRDSGDWLIGLGLKPNQIFTSKNVSLEVLMDMFKVAVLSPSTVTMDLLSRSKPFILVDSIRWHRGVDIVSCDDRYGGYTRSPDLDIKILSDVEFLKSEIELLKNRVFGKNSAISGQKISAALDVIESCRLER